MLHLTPLKSLLLASALALLAATPASAQEKFRVITTFTVIADMAQNVAGDAAVVSSITKPGAEIHDYQPTPGDIKRAQGAQLILSNGLNLERWFARFYQHLQGVPEVVVSEGIQPMGISAGPYSGKPNPHAWMSADNALIYVDNIRDALVKYDPPHADTYRRNAEAYKEKIRQTMAPLQADWRSCRRIALAGHQRGSLLLSGPRLWPARTVSVADQCRPAGHPATGAQGYRHHEERTHPDHLQRKHHLR